ncbi:type I glutamate--ammonia ligase [Candidatus Ichthyocystis hellenicum]|uniref:type I glutamate--ammonia ligase n=1 Tax=Candidatus Ichthyocystis hellenicum TaxID=1561003 RepID=UPI000A4CA527|nr:type I glutamate--ammonia ligase [Candidatus Ichthyocystis hellenicum]
MASSKPSDIVSRIRNENIRFLDYRFSDIFGRHCHLTVPAANISEEQLFEGQTIDGSSFPAWKSIHMSDMVLLPDLDTAMIDPFFQEKTLIFFCNVVDPADGKGYDRDPRTIAKRAENYVKTSGIGDNAFFGPELEFFVFDKVSWGCEQSNCFYKIESCESNSSFSNTCRTGHYPKLKGGYMALPPTDSLHDFRSWVCCLLESVGIPVEIHHHEVGSFGQCEVGTKFSTLVQRSDWVQLVKYVVKNAASRFNKTVTFMPKPILGDNGSGMHCHQSIWKNGKNIFAGNDKIGLSQTALFYIGGILKHARALNAFTNPTVNSYRRLVAGYEAPVRITYSAKNRSAAIRIPYSSSDASRRIEVRFPDPSANPYLSQVALLMAGLDGVINQIDPGEPVDKNLYVANKDILSIPQFSGSIDEALSELDLDRDFLVAPGILSHDFIDAYIATKSEESQLTRSYIHPAEFEMYYDC